MTRLSSHYQDILATGIRKRIIPAKTKEARDWYRAAAQAVKGGGNRREFITGQHEEKKVNKNTGLEPGSMFIFNYDPKHKKTLPVYDTFPLIFPFNVQNDRLYAINLHYLPHAQRAKLMDALHTIANNQKYNNSTKLKISYKILQQLAGTKGWEETIHCYLKKHIKSQIRKIEPRAWDTVVMLPLAKWHGPKAAEYAQR